MNIFLEFAKENKEVIDSEIKQIFENIRPPAQAISSVIKDLDEFSNRDGKRIRPLLVLLAYDKFKGKNPAIRRIAASYELIHNFLLIHDDIMDESELRRGKPTLHRIYEKQYNDPKKGISKAIVTGDTLAFLSYDAIIKSDFSQDEKYRALEVFNDIILKTCYGQIIDFDINTTEERNEEKILLTHEYKTSMYTIEGPLRLGSILAGAEEKHIADIKRFAKPLGIAFQLQDDFLDVYSDQTGKDKFRDLCEGKYTLLIHHALKDAREDQKIFIKDNFGKRDLAPGDGQKFREIFEECGSKRYSENMIKEMIGEAERNLSGSGLPDGFKRVLSDFSQYIMKRKK